MIEGKKKESGAISRREFLKDAGLVVGGAAIGSTVLLAACGGETETVTDTITKTNTATQTKTVTTTGETPAALNIVKLVVNGQEYEVQVEPEDTLREVLHGRLGFISVKDMCHGHGACGSCSVILDGRPVLSCHDTGDELRRCHYRDCRRYRPRRAPTGRCLHKKPLRSVRLLHPWISGNSQSSAG